MVRHRWSLLRSPLQVPAEKGRVKVLTAIARDQAGMGVALTLDSIVGSVDAEVLATGPSAKGPDRGALLRHGPFTLWGFGGGREEMTDAGRALFVNVVAFAAKQGEERVLERRRNGTRDSLFGSLAYTRRSPGYLQTMRRLYLPAELSKASVDEVEKWVEENRPWLRTEGRRFTVDRLARELDLPNHSRRFLDRLIRNLHRPRDADASLAALRRYTGREDLPASQDALRKWFRENRDYLYFSDCDGYRFLVDEQAKERRVPFEKLRGWSSEKLDYRVSLEKLLTAR